MKTQRLGVHIDAQTGWERMLYIRGHEFQKPVEYPRPIRNWLSALKEACLEINRSRRVYRVGKLWKGHIKDVI